MLRMAALAAAHPAIAELDCNPVIAGPQGALVVDARVRIAPTPARRCRSVGPLISRTTSRPRPARPRAIGLVAPDLAGCPQGFAVRVPVPTAPLVELTVELERATCVEELNAVVRERADTGPPAGILEVRRRAARFERRHRLVLVGRRRRPEHGRRRTQATIVAWYDNESGQSSRLVDLAQKVLVPEAA